MWLDAQLVQLMRIAGVELIFNFERLILRSFCREMHLALGPWSVMFLCMWAGIDCPGDLPPEGRKLFADTTGKARTGDLRMLRTCYTGSVPFWNVIPRNVASALTRLLNEQVAFYASFHNNNLTVEVCAMIGSKGLSWGKTGNFWVVSNSTGSVFGIPPNPAHLRIPSFRSTLKLRPGLLYGLGTPRRRGRFGRTLREALKEGHAAFVRKPTLKNFLFIKDLVLLTGSRPSSSPPDWGRLELNDFASHLSRGVGPSWIVENLYNIGISADGVVSRM